jgi:hypothetical protein
MILKGSNSISKLSMDTISLLNIPYHQKTIFSNYVHHNQNLEKQLKVNLLENNYNDILDVF